MKTFGIKEVRDTHVGESCCILGNGPSLKLWTEKFPAIKERHVLFGSNRSWTETTSPYHCVIASLHWTEFARGMVPGVERCFTVNTFAQPGRTKPQGEVEEIPICFIPRIGRPPNRKFHHDLTNGTWAVFVCFYSLQLALWMGFSEIYLIGVDENDNEGHHHDEVKGNRKHHREYWKMVYDSWYVHQAKIKIYQTFVGSAIQHFELREP